MSLNPEFRRNLWLQFSPQRLVAAPLVLGVVFYAVSVVSGDAEVVASTAWTLFYVVTVFWGTRRAADSVAEEVNGRTWDGQRMSALGAWTMSWGKLVGANSYVWYAGLICLAAANVADPGNPPTLQGGVILPLGSALLGQAVAMAASLMFLRKRPAASRLSVTAAQVLGLIAVLLASSELSRLSDLWLHGEVVDWYGHRIAAEDMTAAFLAAFAFWGVVAIYRLMRAELQFRTWPWAWVAFVAFMMIYVQGFFHGALQGWTDARAAWLLPALLTSLVLVYGAVFSESKDVVRYRWLARSLTEGNVARALALVPLWLPTYGILAAVAVASIALGRPSLSVPYIGEFLPIPQILPSPPVLVALLLFVARDLVLILFLNFGERPRRADLAAAIYLLVAYGPLAGIAVTLHVPLLRAALFPTDVDGALAAVLLPLAEAAVMVWLLLRRWRRA